MYSKKIPCVAVVSCCYATVDGKVLCSDEMTHVVTEKVALQAVTSAVCDTCRWSENRTTSEAALTLAAAFGNGQWQRPVAAAFGNSLWQQPMATSRGHKLPEFYMQHQSDASGCRHWKIGM